MEELVLQIGENEYNASFAKNHPNEVRINHKIFNIELLKKIDERIWSLAVNQRVYQIEFDLFPDGNAIIYLDGLAFEVNITDETRRFLKKFARESHKTNDEGVLKIKAPMPGLVVKIPAKEGDKINKGDSVIVIEAMKMENALKTQKSGTVEKIHVREGLPVEKDALLVEIKIEE